MKKLLLILSLNSLVLFILSSCNDEWTDELYEQKISFRAPLTSEGVTDIYLRFQNNGEIQYDLPVVVSGSRSLEKDIDVQVGIDVDTLDILNVEKFGSREDLYYKQLPDSLYKLESSICHIVKGENQGLFPVNLRVGGLNLVDEWVLPLKIEEDKGGTYVPNYRKGWRIALLHIIPFNDYSGEYSATSMNVYIQGNDQIAMAQSTRRMRVINENTVFFYAGMTEEKSEERDLYKVEMKFESPDSISVDSSFIQGKLLVSAPNNEIGFEVLNNPTYTITTKPDETLPYLIHEFCTVDLDYEYQDITSTPGLAISFHAVGSMTMERQINTLIPDRDQAIEW